MTVEEKKAIQSFVMDEISQHVEDQPTMLIDLILSEHSYQIVHQIIGRRLGMHTQMSTALTHLLKAWEGQPREEAA